MQEISAKVDFQNQLKPLVIIRKASKWAETGCRQISQALLYNLLEMFGRKALQIKEVLNFFYSLVMRQMEESAHQALDLLGLLLQYGDNYLHVDYFYAFFCVAHQLALQRNEISEAYNFEEWLDLYTDNQHKKE